MCLSSYLGTLAKLYFSILRCIFLLVNFKEGSSHLHLLGQLKGRDHGFRRISLTIVDWTPTWTKKKRTLVQNIAQCNCESLFFPIHIQKKSGEKEKKRSWRRCTAYLALASRFLFPAAAASGIILNWRHGDSVLLSFFESLKFHQAW